MRRTISVNISHKNAVPIKSRSVSSSSTIFVDEEQQEEDSVILATGSHDHTIKFWDLSNGVCYRTLQHADTVNALAITINGQHLAVAGNPKIKIYEVEEDTEKKKPPTPIAVCEGHSLPVMCVGFHDRTKWMFSGSEDGTIKFWDLRDFDKILHDAKKNLTCLKTYNHRSPVNTAILHPTQFNMISGDQSGSIRIWDLLNDTCTHELIPVVNVGIRSLAVTRDGKLVAAANNKGECFVWQVNNPFIGFSEGLTPLQQIQAHSTYILKCLFSPDGTTFITASADRSIKVWKVPEFTLIKTLNGHQRWVWDCAFSSDSKFIISASTDHTARLWDMERGECIRQFEEHMKGVVCLALFDERLNTPIASQLNSNSAIVSHPEKIPGALPLKKVSGNRAATSLKKVVAL